MIETGGRLHRGRKGYKCEKCGKKTFLRDGELERFRHACTDRTACIHRGAVIGKVDCQSCRGMVKIKIFACPLHGSCHLSRKPLDARACLTCGERQPRA